MTTDEYEELPPQEKEHFFQCSKCGELVDNRELRDVIFHETNHKQKPYIPRIIEKPIPVYRHDRAHASRRLAYDRGWLRLDEQL